MITIPFTLPNAKFSVLVLKAQLLDEVWGLKVELHLFLTFLVVEEGGRIHTSTVLTPTFFVHAACGTGCCWELLEIRKTRVSARSQRIQSVNREAIRLGYTGCCNC